MNIYYGNIIVDEVVVDSKLLIRCDFIINCILLIVLICYEVFK